MERLHGAAGLSALVFGGLLVGSGIGLSMAYVPSQGEAFASVLYLREQGGVGAFVRSLHYHLASGAVVATFLMVTFAILGDLHRERRAQYRLSVLALFLVIAFCFTGYLLPMDQAAYWGTSVRLGIVETIPVVGGMKADLLRGGPAFGAATLPRFYALHVAALPIVFVALVLIGFREALERAARDHGPRLILASLLLTAAAFVVALNLPAPLEPAASTSDTQYVPRPEWYFLWLFQFGKYVQGFPWVESALLPLAGIGVLLLLPALRTSRRQRAIGVSVTLAVMAGLSGMALYEDQDLPAKPQYAEGLAQKAERDYKVECAGCHGTSGKGDGPDAFNLDSL
ncbi:MAG: cytochrome b N-terminal domain-containing protein, partial [Vicinamibacteria bacterium]|nr:cytochrome b N-terminal domain-containing protein [Vicinamibacteria bacterium]